MSSARRPLFPLSSSSAPAFSEARLNARRTRRASRESVVRGTHVAAGVARNRTLGSLGEGIPTSWDSADSRRDGYRAGEDRRGRVNTSEWSGYTGVGGGLSGAVDGSTLFGRTMGFVALTAGLFAAGAYLGRSLSYGLGFALFIAAFGCLIAMRFAVRRGPSLVRDRELNGSVAPAEQRVGGAAGWKGHQCENNR